MHLTGKSVAALMSESDDAAMHPDQTRPGLWEAIVDWRTQGAFDWPDLTPSPGRTGGADRIHSQDLGTGSPLVAITGLGF